MTNRHIYFFLGTMAEYIKLSPIIKRLNKNSISYKIILSGQSPVHIDQLEEFTGSVKVNLNLKPKSKKSSVTLFLLWAFRTLFLEGFYLRKEFKDKNKKNSYFFVHGDTVSSLIGTLIAKFYGLKIVHIESGLRSFSFLEPFPEEISRFIIIHLADVLFAPTDWAKRNLKGMPGEKISTKYNTLVEPCLWAVNSKGKPDLLKDKKLGKYYILIMHRQEHVIFSKDWTKKTLEFVLNNSPESLTSIFNMHHLTKVYLKDNKINKSKRKMKVIPTIPYKAFIKLMYNAEYMATDGCTNQEEAFYLGLPLLALRHRTERIEGLNKNVLIYKDDKRSTINFLSNYKKYRFKKIKPNASPSKIIYDYLFEN